MNRLTDKEYQRQVKEVQSKLDKLSDEEVRERLNKIKTDFLNQPSSEKLPEGATDLYTLIRIVDDPLMSLLIRALKKFPDFKASINASGSNDFNGRTPLMIAVRKNKDLAITLLEEGANPMAITSSGEGVGDSLRISTLPRSDKIEIRNKILDVLFKQPGRDVGSLLATEKQPFSKLPSTAVETIGTYLTGRTGTLEEQRANLIQQLRRIGGRRNTKKRKANRKYTKRRV